MMNGNTGSAEELGSVSGWLYELKDGNRDAIDSLWNRYFSKLVGFAKKRIGGGLERGLDEEDIAIVAFTQFVDGAENGKFRQLQNRNDLWQILTMITSRRVHNSRRGNSANFRMVDFSDCDVIESLLVDPTPQFLDDLNEDCKELIKHLPERSRTIAMLRLKNCTNQEIADELNLSVATIERDVRAIRES